MAVVGDRRRRRLWLALAGAGCLVLLLAWIRCGPLPPGFLEPGKHHSTAVVDRHGVPLYESLSGTGARSAWLSPQELPETLVSATLAAEDRRFYWHSGLDPLAIARAAWHDARSLRLAEGGSTLTQQAVKRLMERPRSVPGKLREMLYALRLEHRLSKDEILALYLSVAPYGNQYVGAKAASEGYFGCPPENLTPAQAAFLAGLPQRPTALDPYRRFPEAQKRQRQVLLRMRVLGKISEAEYRHALDERLRIVRSPKAFAAPHFVERVLEGLGERRALRVETTLDAQLQREVLGIIEARRQDLERHSAHNVAVAVLSNETAEWLAWEGSGDYSDVEHGGAIDGLVSPRQPGSALKPFTYALAFERGYTPASVLPDVPANFSTGVAGVVYSPRNYDGVFRGPLRARAALGGSENVPAVWLLSRLGVADLLSLLRRAGLSGLDKTAEFYGYGLTLGDAEVRLDELVAAYSALARGGVYLEPAAVRRIEWAEGRSEEALPAHPRRIVSERAAYWVTDILSDAEARAYIFGRGGSLDFPFPVAAKTGTSQAYRDNWTVGYTREVTVGVWVGNFDRSELVDSSGITGAGPIFHSVLLAAQKRALGRLPADGDPPLAEPPPGLAPLRVCALSGMAATRACPSSVTERLPEERRPLPCQWHVSTKRVTEVAWPSQYRDWALRRGLAREGEWPAARPSRLPAAPLRILSPPPGATFLIDPTLRMEYQALALKAAVEGVPRRLAWSVDGEEVGRAGSDASLHWTLVRGDHTVCVRDEQGHFDSAKITVK
jgi:penicillin-binding protein 1C